MTTISPERLAALEAVAEAAKKHDPDSWGFNNFNDYEAFRDALALLNALPKEEPYEDH